VGRWAGGRWKEGGREGGWVGGREGGRYLEGGEGAVRMQRELTSHFLHHLEGGREGGREEIKREANDNSALERKKGGSEGGREEIPCGGVRGCGASRLGLGTSRAAASSASSSRSLEERREGGREGDLTRVIN